MASHTDFTADEAKAIAEQTTTPRLMSFPIAAAGMICLGEGWLGDNPLVVTALILLTACMTLCWTSTFHETGHQTLWSSRRLNVWCGRVLGTLMFVPYSVYREVHIRHHAYLNRPADWELWPYTDPQKSLTFRRAYVWFDLAFGIISGAFVYSRMYWHKNSPIRGAALRRTIRHEYVAIVLFWGAVWTLTTLLGTWRGHAMGILVPLWIAGILQTGRKLTEHVGMASYDPLLGTRTVLPHKWLLRISSFLNFDIFIHGPHHRHPRITHNQLKSTMSDYVKKNPETRYPVFHNYWEAVWEVVPVLFRNPGCGMNAGAAAPAVLKHADVQDFVSDVVDEVLADEDPVEKPPTMPTSRSSK